MSKVNFAQARDLSHLKNGSKVAHQRKLDALKRDATEAAMKAGELLCDRIGGALEDDKSASLTTPELAWYESFARTAGASCTIQGNVESGEFWRAMHEKVSAALAQRQAEMAVAN